MTNSTLTREDVETLERYIVTQLSEHFPEAHMIVRAERRVSWFSANGRSVSIYLGSAMADHGLGLSVWITGLTDQESVEHAVQELMRLREATLKAIEGGVEMQHIIVLLSSVHGLDGVTNTANTIEKLVEMHIVLNP